MVSPAAFRRPSLSKDCRGVAATEFVMIVPLMMVMFFGVVEFSSGVAVDRKVTLVARTLSDLTSQSTSVTDTDLSNFFAASAGILTPYPATPTQSTITELYVDPTTLQGQGAVEQGLDHQLVGQRSAGNVELLARRSYNDPDRACGGQAPI